MVWQVKDAAGSLDHKSAGEQIVHDLKRSIRWNIRECAQQLKRKRLSGDRQHIEEMARISGERIETPHHQIIRGRRKLERGAPAQPARRVEMSIRHENALRAQLRQDFVDRKRTST